MGHNKCESSPEYANGVYVAGPFAITPGTAIPGTDIQPDLENIYRTVSVVNDTDQDVRITYSTSGGYNGNFVVPKSIKGFTKTLKNGELFVTTSFIAISLHAASQAAGNITFNFSS